MNVADAGAVLALDGLATLRLTRLVASDYLTAPWRDRFIVGQYRRRAQKDGLGPSDADLVHDPTSYALHDKDAPRLAYLVTCWWCVSVWLAAGVVAARWCIPTVWNPVAWLLACSAVAASIGQALDR